ncbi:acyl-CoA N-acyltransferase [Neoconidiobolus thromboides FSU 785]|nr:acyl-CoA N-acyltransferase [Neoconidiobolus thromboides FSU 785]
MNKLKLNSLIGWECELYWGNQLITATIISERISQNKEKEYYLHFGNLDTKYDQWVNKNKIETFSEGEFSYNLKQDKGNTSKRIIAHSERKPLTFEEYPIKNVYNVFMNDHFIPCYYPSPYPDHYYYVKTLLICHYCFQYFQYTNPYEEHLKKCNINKYQEHQIVYCTENEMIMKLDGEEEKLLCQNLCLFSKLFISHKDICYSLKGFNFYLLFVKINDMFQPVAYFSKEKEFKGNNLACILTFPAFQNKGYGTLLIEFSYKLSKVEGKMGSAERPLSKSGYRSYLRYWMNSIIDILLNYQGKITLEQISKLTFITENDLLIALNEMELLNNTSWNEPLLLNRNDINLIIQKRRIKLISQNIDINKIFI